MTDVDPLKADCSACFGLCCSALRLERADGFGHDKPAGVPCHFLQQDYRCKIHPRRQDLGYEGCIDFDCLGAGQIASKQFAAQNWKQDTAVARQMFARFAELMQIQELRAALTDAGGLGLESEPEAARLALLHQLAIAAETGANVSSARAGAEEFIQSLRD